MIFYMPENILSNIEFQYEIKIENYIKVFLN